MQQDIKILIICGTGIATSTMVAAKLRDHLAERDDAGRFAVLQGKVADLLRDTREADVIVATTGVPSSVDVPVVNAVPLLTGVGADAVFAELDEIISKLSAAR